MARPGRQERNRTAQSFRQLTRFHHGINSDEVFGTHRLVVERFTDVSISDGIKIYSIAEFSLVMALQEIANTVEAAAELGPKAKVK
jgi:hypothetical protein